jgi:hypothetical protein
VAASCYCSSASSKDSYPVYFKDGVKFVDADRAEFKGEVDSDFAHLTQALFDESALELEATATRTDDSTKAAGKGPAHRLPKFARPFRLNITIYGPTSLFEEIGSFFDEHDVYLQDPVGSDRNVPYCNPHRLPWDGVPEKMTGDFAKPPLHPVIVDDVATRPELLDALNSSQDFAEAEQPISIRTPLAR